MKMRPSHMGDLQAIMSGAKRCDVKANEFLDDGNPRAAQVYATLGLGLRLDAMIHIQLYSTPDDQEELRG